MALPPAIDHGSSDRQDQGRRNGEPNPTDRMRECFGLYGHQNRDDRDDRDLRGETEQRGLPRRRASAVDDPRERDGEEASEQVELCGESEQQGGEQDAPAPGRPGAHPLVEGGRIDRPVRTAQEERPDHGERRAESPFGDDEDPFRPQPPRRRRFGVL